MNADSWLNHALKFGSAWPEEQVAAIGIAILGSMAAFSSRRYDRYKARTSCTSQYAPYKKHAWSTSDLFHVCFLVAGAMLSTTPTLSHTRQPIVMSVSSGMKIPPRVHAGKSTLGRDKRSKYASVVMTLACPQYHKGKYSRSRLLFMHRLKKTCASTLGIAAPTMPSVVLRSMACLQNVVCRPR